ncbi:hypothetical protein AMTRI_Chr09g17550 [Amborella trichopoda]|uniref:RING-type domain-containing protein n=1 Tax=Amborella trichopoda TaxID=13333 RepID=W1PE51_AMBTC|nr:RING-H2 finger protein ATL79 [Amborella trichopoda]ERN08202.1 hypothetical protein AMTR_s00018p00191870 [Amborella trichopoda]|eukprot:XP_006846527.1 RING-H2 finger protein ATL79 [Amborella trichopoda]
MSLRRTLLSSEDLSRLSPHDFHSSSPPPLQSKQEQQQPLSSGRWAPYSNAGELDVNLAMVLVFLVCALACALALNAALRCAVNLLARREPQSRGRAGVGSGEAAEKSPAVAAAPPALVYSAGMGLPGSVAECAICLTEFCDGERIRVLPNCGHGFHAGCVERWLAAHVSCPTCRRSCLPSATGEPQ